ncbi:hypothetical protein NQF87_05120 [Bombella sp. TMW 2.2559]|uniref:Uncharacterized protein n=1 Tax=Bombella dulcis TaxID=2967339 RepID=A0ABT3WB88_9PROT|nr:hypothetical protein [Bombella dulcis]MCX5616355.1 hypothetical protein [Bombella dulcis]
MSNMTVDMDGVPTDIGDPNNSDEVYLSGERQLFSDARTELISIGQLGMIDYQQRGGPKTRAYLQEIKRLAESRIIYGRWPQVPDRIED